MAASRGLQGCWRELLVNQFVSPLAILALLLGKPSVTQLTFGNAPVTTTPPPSTEPLPSQSVTSTPHYQPYSATSFYSAPTNTPDDDDDLPPTSVVNYSSSATSFYSTPTNTPDDDDDVPPTSVVNYYFLLLALLVLILLALLWTFHRHRKRKLALSRNGGHNALAQDLEGWRENRRWAAYSGGRGWRNVFSGHGQRREGRGEEHPDERGEAPPPYDYVAEGSRPAGVVPGRSRSRDSDLPERTRGYGRDRAGRTSIPLHVLNESGEEGKPPEYGRT